MAITRNISGTIKNQTITIDGKKIPMDHILQITLTTGLGVIGDPVEVNMTYQMYRLILGKDRASLVGSNVKITIDNSWDAQTGDSGDNINEYFAIDGYITHVREYTTAKQNYVWLMCMSKEYVELSQHRKFINEDGIHTHEVLQSVLQDCNISMSTTDNNLSTYWESFGMPMSTPSIDYVKDLLDKDGVLYYSLTSVNGNMHTVYLATWYDINNMLKIVEKMDPDWTYGENRSEKYLANFGLVSTKWAEATFTKSRQTNTKAQWNVMESDLAHANDIYENILHQNCYFEDGKDPKYFYPTDGDSSKNPDVVPDDKIYKYTGRDIITSSIQPYYNNPALFKNEETPKSKSFSFPSNLVWNPKYWHQRMVHSYVGSKRLFRCDVTVAGRLTARAPLTCLQLSYYPNRYYEGGEEQSSAERNKSKIASGLYLITHCVTVISGNNIINKYTMLKPCPENERLASIEEMISSSLTTSSFFNNSIISGSLTNAISGVINTINNPSGLMGSISNVSSSMGNLGSSLSNIVGGLGGITDSVSNIVTNIGGLYGNISDFMNNPQFSGIVGNVGNVVDSVTNTLNNLGVDTSKITDFTNQIGNIGQNLSGFFDGSIDMQDVRQMASLVGLDDELDKVQNFLGKAQSIYDLGSNFMDNLSNTFSSLGNLTDIQDILNQVKEGNFTGSLDELKDILTTVSSSTSGLLDNIQEMADIAGLDINLSEFTGVLDKVGNVASMVQTGFDAFTNIANGLSNGKIDLDTVSDLVGNISPEAQKLLDNITGTTQKILPSVSKLVDKFGSFENIKNAINGITSNGVSWEDIQSMQGTINEFKDIAQGLGINTSNVESINNVIDTIGSIRDNYGKISDKVGELRTFASDFKEGFQAGYEQGLNGS